MNIILLKLNFFLENGKNNKESLLSFYLILSIIGVQIFFYLYNLSFWRHYCCNLLISLTYLNHIILLKNIYYLFQD